MRPLKKKRRNPAPRPVRRAGTVLRAAAHIPFLILVLLLIVHSDSRQKDPPAAPVSAHPPSGSARSIIVEAEQEYRDALYSRSLSSFRRALAISAVKGDWADVSRCWSGIGENEIRLERFGSAQAAFDSALQIAAARLTRPGPETAAGWVGLGRLRFEQENFDSALACYRRALPLAAADPPLLGLAYQRIGQAHIANTRFSEAMDCIDTCLAVLRTCRSEDHPDFAEAYLLAGTVYKSRHDWENALIFFNRALDIDRLHLGEWHPEVGRAYENLGTLYMHKEDFAAAMDFQKKALLVYTRALGPDHPSVAGVHNHMGYIHAQKKEYGPMQEELLKGLAVCMKNPERNRLLTAEIEFRIGHVYILTHRPGLALIYYRRALAIRTQILNPRSEWMSESYKGIGDALRDLGRYREALRNYQKALIATHADFNDPNIRSNPDIEGKTVDFSVLSLLWLKARTLERMVGCGEGGTADLETALSTWELAMRLMDRLGSGILSVEPRLNLAADFGLVYGRGLETAAALYARTGDERFKEKAFLFSEKAKVFVQLRSLMDERAMTFGGVPTKLIREESRLRTEYRELEKDIRDETAGRPDVESGRLKSLKARRFAVKREWNDLIVRLQREFPDYLSVRYGDHVVTVRDLRDRLIGPRDALVEYFTGDRFVTIFTVTDSIFEMTRVPRPPDLESRVRGVRDGIVAMDYGRYTDNAHWCWRALVLPVEPWIRGRSLIVIPDGFLSGLAFEALLTRPPAGGTEDYRGLAYLVRDHAVGYHYSAMMFIEYRAGTEKKPGPFVGFAPGRY